MYRCCHWKDNLVCKAVSVHCNGHDETTTRYTESKSKLLLPSTRKLLPHPCSMDGRVLQHRSHISLISPYWGRMQGNAPIKKRHYFWQKNCCHWHAHKQAIARPFPLFHSALYIWFRNYFAHLYSTKYTLLIYRILSNAMLFCLKLIKCPYVNMADETVNSLQA